jgi:hypothetical protein
MRTYLADLAERTLATYAAAFVGLLLAGGVDLTSLSAWQAAAVAALPAAVTVVKGAAGTLIGDRSSAAWLPRGRP